MSQNHFNNNKPLDYLMNRSAVNNDLAFISQ